MIQTDATAATETAVSKSGIPIRNLWYMLLYVWNAFEMKDQWRVEVEQSPSLDALLGSILARLIQQRLRIGLGRNYKHEESQVSGIRGRVDFAESLKRLAFQHGRAHCRYETFSANIPKNQIVRSTLARLVQIGDFGPDRALAENLRATLRRLVRNLDAVDLVELKREQIRRRQLDRNDSDYTLMLAICLLLLQRQMPTEAPGESKLPAIDIDRDSLTLGHVFEQFIAKFYKTHSSGEWDISSQRRIHWPTEKDSPYLPAMYLDLEMQHKRSHKLVVLDTKFTASILVTGRWGNLVFDRSHLFQIYAYLRSQAHRSESHRSATGILLYPTVHHRLSEAISVQGHEIRWETIDLARQ
jgi:5-methylcytosine-specific restriction enzyme subunit McrC